MEAEVQSIITAMRIIPLDDRILVKRASAEDRTVGGIILPASAQKEPPAKGTVLEVGPMVNHKPYVFREVRLPDHPKLPPPGETFSGDMRFPDVWVIAEGDVVLFNKFAGVEFDANDKEGRAETLLIMKRDEIYAVVRPQVEEEKECPEPGEAV